MNVLIAIDSSPTAQAALAAALARTWPEGTHFIVMTVLPKLGKQADASAEKHTQLEKANHLIDRAVSLIEENNQDSIVIGHIDYGEPATSILAIANSWPADLVIVGSHDRGPLERLVMGSVSRKVLDRARCSVLVARNFDSFLNRVLIAVDSSVSSNSVVTQLLHTDWPEHTHFHLLTVVDPPAIGSFEPSSLFVGRQIELYNQNVEQADAMLADAVDQIECSLGRSCATYTVAQGHAKDAILETARSWQPDLIVTGSSGLMGWKERLFGSVSKDVARRADCSVQIIRSNVVGMPMQESEGAHPQHQSAGNF